MDSYAASKRTKIVFGFIFVLLLLALYWTFNPEQAPFPKCPFLWLTGLKCPGCGSQRALHSLLHLQIGQAFRYNAAMLLLAPVLLLLLASDLLRRRIPALYRIAHSPALAWGLVIFILLWWILRNVFGW